MPRLFWSPNSGAAGQQAQALQPGQNLQGQTALAVDGTDVVFPAPGGGLLRVPVGGGAAAPINGTLNGQLWYYDQTAGLWVPTPTAPADGDIARWDAVANTWKFLAPPTPGALAYFDNSLSPVGLWNFNSTLADQSGNGNDFALEAGSINYADIVPGKRGVWIFNGVRYGIAASTPVLALTGDMTVETIVQLNSTPSGTFQICTYTGPGETEANNFLYTLNVVSTPTNIVPINVGAFWENGTGTDVIFTTTSPFSLPPIHNIMYIGQVRSAGGTRIQNYVNGKPFGALSGALLPPTGGTTSRLLMGSSSAASTAVESGIIMAIRITASAKSAAQMLAGYNQTMGPAFGVLT